MEDCLINVPANLDESCLGPYPNVMRMLLPFMVVFFTELLTERYMYITLYIVEIPFVASLVSTHFVSHQFMQTICSEVRSLVDHQGLFPTQRQPTPTTRKLPKLEAAVHSFTSRESCFLLRVTVDYW